MEGNSIKQRLLSFLKSQGVTQTEFCRRMGVSPAYVNSMRKSLPEEKVLKICDLFPDLNRDWLIFGDGDMTLPESGKSSRHIPKDEDEYWVPLLPAKAAAGGIQATSDSVTLAECERIRVPVKGIDYAIQIFGNSMEPMYLNGDTLLIKRIDERRFIPWGNPMVVDTNNGVMLKCLYPDEASTDEFIWAKSYNPDYPPFRISTFDINALYRVQGLIRINSFF